MVARGMLQKTGRKVANPGSLTVARTFPGRRARFVSIGPAIVTITATLIIGATEPTPLTDATIIEGRVPGCSSCSTCNHETSEARVHGCKGSNDCREYDDCNGCAGPRSMGVAVGIVRDSQALANMRPATMIPDLRAAGVVVEVTPLPHVVMAQGFMVTGEGAIAPCR